MTAQNLADLMDALGVALSTITGLRVFDFPPLSAQPPFAFVNLPEEIAYDLTYGRGADRTKIEIYVGVANQVDRTARDAIVAYAAGAGPKSVKAAVEAAEGLAVQVTTATFATIALSSASYAGLIFTVDAAL